MPDAADSTRFGGLCAHSTKCPFLLGHLIRVRRIVSLRRSLEVHYDALSLSLRALREHVRVQLL